MKVVAMDDLPEGCVSNILWFTSPVDACRFAVLNKTFRSASESDQVWDRFLGFDYHHIISKSVASSLSFSTKKQLYCFLSDSHILIDDGNKSFWLEKHTGKKCYGLAAREISIIWSDTSRYWQWTSLPESRFAEVAELLHVWWFEIRGKISTNMLSPQTIYEAYLIFRWASQSSGFKNRTAEVHVDIVGFESSEKQTVYLDPEPRLRRQNQNASRERRDGWLEVKLGEYFNDEGHEEEILEMSIMEVKHLNLKQGIFIEGIEVRPK